MLNEERKKRIAELVNKDGVVQIQQFADLFNVSIYTIRRDLSDLEKKGLIRKTHGGAVRVEKSVWLPTIEEGQKEAVEEKKAIALKASQYIDNGDTVFFMGSTISHMMIPYLSQKRITVVTNSLDVAKALSSMENIETIIIGGKIKNYKGNVLGSRAVEDIGCYHFDRAFIPCAGVHHKKGATTSTLDSADFTRAVINSSSQNILIADYRKVGRVTFCKICDISHINVLITDDKADKNELDNLSKKGVNVYIAN
jgi:DeoR/GlpR family transcriptional regulator of sugar metabolism